MRETWRRQRFVSFKESGRRDANAVRPTAAYSETRVTAVRKAYREQCTHGKAVLIGAVVSDARMHRILGEDMQACAWCNSGEAPTWVHMAWYVRALQIAVLV